MQLLIIVVVCCWPNVALGWYLRNSRTCLSAAVPLARLLRLLVLPVSRLHRLGPLRGEPMPATVRPVQPGGDLGPGDPAAGGVARAAVAARLHEAQAQHQGEARGASINPSTSLPNDCFSAGPPCRAACARTSPSPVSASGAAGVNCTESSDTCERAPWSSTWSPSSRLRRCSRCR